MNVTTTHAALTIHGDTGADTINVTDANAALTVNGGTDDDTVTITDSHGITTVNGGLGADTVTLVTTHGVTTINGDAGDDTVTVTDAYASLTVNGGGDNDTITITDTHAATTVNGGLGADGITLVDAHGVTAINGGDGADTIVVKDTHAALTVHGDGGADKIRILAVHAPTEAYGDAGDDDFVIGSKAPSLGGVLDLIAAHLKISGGAGGDSVQVDDTGDTTGNIGYLTDSRIAGLGMTIDSAHTAAEARLVDHRGQRRRRHVHHHDRRCHHRADPVRRQGQGRPGRDQRGAGWQLRHRDPLAGDPGPRHHLPDPLGRSLHRRTACDQRQRFRTGGCVRHPEHRARDDDQRLHRLRHLRDLLARPRLR